MDAPFSVDIDLTYHPYRIPPRCRKPRKVAETFSFTRIIPTVTSDDAPVAAHIPSRSEGDLMLRAWDGKLLRPVTEYGMNGPVVVEAGSDRFPRSVAKKTFEEDLTAAIARVDEEYSELVIVNGEVWKVATEPTYVIHTMGLGNNYGGTALSIESGRMETMSRRCFSLLERDAAVEAALEVARDRGDTRSYDLIRESDSATILIPSAFSIPTHGMRQVQAENDVLALIDQAVEGLAGDLTKSRLQTVIDELENAREQMFTHGLEKVTREG